MKRIEQAIIDLDIENISGLVKGALDDGTPPLKILDELIRGLNEVGDRFSAKTYFLSDLIMASETMKEAMKILEPVFKAGEVKSKGRVVIGTIVGDIHDFGKNIVITLLKTRGIEVIDLGVDIPPRKFAVEVARNEAPVCGISAVLSTTQPRSADVVEELERMSIRDQTKVILGGGGSRDEYIEKYGLDAVVTDAVKGVTIIESWLEAKPK